MKQQQVQRPRPRKTRERDDVRPVKQTPAQDATWKRAL